MKALKVALVSLIATHTRVTGHGTVRHPTPRNVVDHDDIPAQSNQTYPYRNQACPSPDGEGNTSGQLGQACYWFSNGCSIGCPQCDGTSRGPIPTSHDPRWRRKMDTCGSGAKATLCDSSKRTVNVDAECGAGDDWYYYSPWRSPGSAGVYDSCGMAGGTPKSGAFGGNYVTTAHAKQGDLGTQVLKQGAAAATWTTGTQVEVSWTILANHGGGYQYRLCPANETLDEACFSRMPLPFAGRQSLRWDAHADGTGGTRVWFDGVYVSDGVIPPGAAWARNPIPRNDHKSTGTGFAPACEEADDCDVSERVDPMRCRCSGMWGPYNLEIVDTLQLPAHLPPGDYVLGWRWDCEESNQIWMSCSDVKVVLPRARER